MHRLHVYFLAAGAQSVAQVGLANDVAPGATTGTVWLTSYPPGADTSTAAGTAREVSVADAASGRPGAARRPWRTTGRV